MTTLMLAAFWLPDAATLGRVAPELVLLAAIVAILLAPLLGLGRSAASAAIAFVGVAAALAAAVAAYGPLLAGPVELFGPVDDAGAIPGTLLVDRFSGLFRLLILGFLLAILAMWRLFEADRTAHAAEFLVLLLSSALGMLLMAGSVNLLMMLVAIELASLPSYVLAGFDRDRRTAAEASLKYVIFGAVCSGFAIYGVSVLYGLFGTLHLPTLVERGVAAASGDLSAGTLAVLGFGLLAVFVGIGFKISAVPFHFWCPDVFEGASLTIATWLSVASKAAGVVLLLRLVFILAGGRDATAAAPLLALVVYGLAGFAILTSTYANLAALGQRSVRRLLAYSSIAHAGYMLAAGAIVVRTADGSTAMAAIGAYLLIYLFMNLGAFLALGLVAAERESEQIEAFAGLGWRAPITAAALTLCLVSLVGLPPMGGFVAKFWLVYALGEAAVAGSAALAGVLWTLVLAIVLNTALSLFYYMRIVREMYFRGLEQPAPSSRAPLAARAGVQFCAVLLLLAGTLLIGPVKRIADGGARSLGAATTPAVGAPATIGLTPMTRP